MSHFATKTIAAFTFCLALALSCGTQAGEFDNLSDDEYYFLLSIGAIEEKPMPPVEMTQQPKIETQSQPSASSISGFQASILAALGFGVSREPTWAALGFVVSRELISEAPDRDAVDGASRRLPGPPFDALSKP